MAKLQFNDKDFYAKFGTDGYGITFKIVIKNCTIVNLNYLNLKDVETIKRILSNKNEALLMLKDKKFKELAEFRVKNLISENLEIKDETNNVQNVQMSTSYIWSNAKTQPGTGVRIDWNGTTGTAADNNMSTPKYNI